MIEQLSPDRFADILPIFRQVQHLHASERPGTFRSDWDESEMSEFFAQRVKDGAICLVHRDKGMATGYLVYRILETSQTPIKRAERFGMLDEVAVDAAHRRTGIAGQLVTAMRHRLAQDRVTVWRVSYHDFNAASAALMAGQGARPIVHVAEGAV